MASDASEKRRLTCGGGLFRRRRGAREVKSSVNLCAGIVYEDEERKRQQSKEEREDPKALQRPHGDLLGIALKGTDQQRRNTSAEAVAVHQHVSESSGTRNIGNKIEIALWIRNFLINGRGSDLMLDRETCCGGLKGSSRGNRLPNH